MPPSPGNDLRNVTRFRQFRGRLDRPLWLGLRPSTSSTGDDIALTPVLLVRLLAIATSLTPCLVLAATVATACAGRASEGEVRRSVASWDSAKASAHLQARAAKWFDERACALSCHTTHPFVLVGDGSPIRERIVAAVRKR